MTIPTPPTGPPPVHTGTETARERRAREREERAANGTDTFYDRNHLAVNATAVVAALAAAGLGVKAFIFSSGKGSSKAQTQVTTPRQSLTGGGATTSSSSPTTTMPSVTTTTEIGNPITGNGDGNGTTTPTDPSFVYDPGWISAHQAGENLKVGAVDCANIEADQIKFLTGSTHPGGDPANTPTIPAATDVTVTSFTQIAKMGGVGVFGQIRGIEFSATGAKVILDRSDPATGYHHDDSLDQVWIPGRFSAKDNTFHVLTPQGAPLAELPHVGDYIGGMAATGNGPGGGFAKIFVPGAFGSATSYNGTVNGTSTSVDAIGSAAVSAQGAATNLGVFDTGSTVFACANPNITPEWHDSMNNGSGQGAFIG